MKVSIGTIEISDDDRKTVRRAMGQRGHATRNDVKEWALELIQRELNPEAEADTRGQEPATAPRDADSLPEPAPPAPAFAGTSATT